MLLQANVDASTCTWTYSMLKLTHLKILNCLYLKSLNEHAFPHSKCVPLHPETDLCFVVIGSFTATTLAGRYPLNWAT
jgi:hypothetical protein